MKHITAMQALYATFNLDFNGGKNTQKHKLIILFLQWQPPPPFPEIFRIETILWKA